MKTLAQLHALECANAARCREAAVRKSHAAQMALHSAVDPIPRQVLELRIAHPQMSLAELGKRCDPPMTKDAYSSHLRRALFNAGVDA